MTIAIDTPPAVLAPTLEAHARRYIAARTRSGDALLEAVAALADARAAAAHGEWGIFLQAVGLDDSRARALIRLHEACLSDAALSDRVRSGWISEAAARELLPAPADVRAAVLDQAEPPTLQDVREAKRAATPDLYRVQMTPEARDADGPWFKARKSAAHPTAHHWNIRPTERGTYVAACGIIGADLLAADAHVGLCGVCARHADRRELVPWTMPERAATPDLPPPWQSALDTARQFGHAHEAQIDRIAALAQAAMPQQPIDPDARMLLSKAGWDIVGTARQKGSTTFYTFRHGGTHEERELAAGEVPFWAEEVGQAAERKAAQLTQADAQHMQSIDRILSTLDQWADSARPAQIHDAYSHAREIRDTVLHARAFERIDAALDDTKPTFSSIYDEMDWYIGRKDWGGAQTIIDRLPTGAKGARRDLARQLEKGRAAAAPPPTPHLPDGWADAQRRAETIGLHLTMNMAGVFSLKNEQGAILDTFDAADWHAALAELARKETQTLFCVTCGERIMNGHFDGQCGSCYRSPTRIDAGALGTMAARLTETSDPRELATVYRAIGLLLATGGVLPALPSRPRAPRSADASCSLAYLGKLETYVEALEQRAGVRE